MKNNTRDDVLVMLGIQDSKVKQIPQELESSIDRFEELMIQFGRSGISAEGLAVLIRATELATGKNFSEIAQKIAKEAEEVEEPAMPETTKSEASYPYSEEMKHEDLKTACQKLGLKDYGTKAQMVERLNATKKEEVVA